MQQWKNIPLQVLWMQVMHSKPYLVHKWYKNIISYLKYYKYIYSLLCALVHSRENVFYEYQIVNTDSSTHELYLTLIAA